MIFTDDDLRRFKEEIDSKKRYLGSFDLWALIARLEAAERCAELLGLVIDGQTLNEVTQAWRKAAGK